MPRLIAWGVTNRIQIQLVTCPNYGNPMVSFQSDFFLVDRKKKKKNYYLSSITTCLLLPHCLISMEGVNKHADRLILAKRSKRTFINKKE